LLLGEAGLMRSLLAEFPGALQDKVRYAIAHLDRLALEMLPLSPELRSRALFLFDLRGRPADVLQRVSSLELNAHQREIVNRLKSLVELLAECSPQLPVILDLSLLQTFDYYTGIVFEVVTDTGDCILGQGGRYDQLLGLYHPQREDVPGTGFCLNIEELQGCLLPSGVLPQETVPCDWLVVPVDGASAAFVYAQKLRASGDLVRVEVDFGQRETRDAVREYARQRRIKHIAWVKDDGEAEIESMN
jgi:ATP phosphoribosyltransferase regulatory subunit